MRVLDPLKEFTFRITCCKWSRIFSADSLEDMKEWLGAIVQWAGMPMKHLEDKLNLVNMNDISMNFSICSVYSVPFKYLLQTQPRIYLAPLFHLVGESMPNGM